MKMASVATLTPAVAMLALRSALEASVPKKSEAPSAVSRTTAGAAMDTAAMPQHKGSHIARAWAIEVNCRRVLSYCTVRSCVLRSLAADLRATCELRATRLRACSC